MTDLAQAPTIQLAAPTAPALAQAGGDIDDVLQRLRWHLSEVAVREVVVGGSSRDGGGGIRFHYVLSGSVDLGIGDETISMRAGDFAMLTRPDGVEVAGVEDGSLLTGTFAVDSPDGTERVLPPVLFVCRLDAREPVIVSLLESMRSEFVDRRPGSHTVLDRSADVVASAALRIWFERGCDEPRRWFAAALDPHLARAIDAIHEAPGEHWTVESLARLARASRSQFAEQFRTALDETPARYLTRVRMERAEGMLRDGWAVAQIAFELGYDSDAGFSRAFRRHAGVSPSSWQRSARHAHGAAGRPVVHATA
ncbi:AraC family transcriptional regulator [Agromyces protaetiae]|uniref:AraC family transcriptional regulator n=1 Tax=Agromyces protaetiae TaxID=2509455 RepID=A0A4V0YGU3_9MICO|nr:AraC family transcriptional regulator [Agromyces protaetiae]QAY72411.1 AraC family transcriptional regulator [Agromyces protaetiae]